MDRPKRLSNKPRRYKTTSSEDKMKKKKPKPLDEAKTKKKVFESIQNISDEINVHNTACASTYSVNGNATITKPSIIEDRIYSTTYAPQTTYNEKQKKLLYTPISLNGPRPFNQNVYNMQNVQNCENIPPRNVTIDNSYNIQKENMQQLDSYENSLEHIFTREATKTASETHKKHTIMENSEPHNEMYIFQNDQLRPRIDSNDIQELVTVPSSIIPQSIEPPQIQLSNITTPVIEQKQNVQLYDLLKEVKHEMQSINERLNTIERKIELNVVNAMPQKPQLLPFSTIDAMEMFQKETDDHEDVVHYFKFLNSVTLKDSVHQCIKEAMIMELAGKFTWWGINDKKFPFYNTVLSQAIFQAVATNRYYPKPTREEFQREVVGSLKIAKQRILNARGRHPGLSENRRNLEEAANALYNEDANHLQANKLVQNADNNHREMESEIESDDSNES